MAHITISYVERALVQETNILPGRRAVSLYGTTDAHGYLTLAVPIPRNVKLRNGRAEAHLVVRAAAGPLRRLGSLSPLVSPHVSTRIAIKYTPNTFIRAAITFRGHRPIELVNITDRTGHLTLLVTVPRDRLAYRSPIAAQIVVWAVDAASRAEATARLNISDLVVTMSAGPISKCAQLETIHVAYRPQRPVHIAMTLPNKQALALSRRTDEGGYSTVRVRIFFAKVAGQARIRIAARDATPGIRRQESIIVGQSVPRACLAQNLAHIPIVH